MTEELSILLSEGLSVAEGSEANKPLVFVLLLNYRGVKDTLTCLASLKKLDYDNLRVVVIDNASEDGSVERLRMAKESLDGSYPRFYLIESPYNGGFSAGNNLGIDYAIEQGADYVWLLNNDTTVEPDTLTHVLAESEKTAGLAGSLLLNWDETYQQVGTRLNWYTGKARGIPESNIRDNMAVPCLSGASLLIPIKVIRDIGMLDATYFLYFEDSEYCIRAKRAGYATTISLKSRVLHKESASTGKGSLATQYYYQRNRLKMLAVYATPFQKVTIGLYTIFRLLRSKLKGHFGSAERQASATVYWLAVQDFLKGVDGQCPHNLTHQAKVIL